MVLALVVAVAFTATQVPLGATSSSFPARIEYDLFYVENEHAVDLAMASFVVRVDSWSSWRHEQVCCDEYTGYVQEWRPDGTMWSGYEEWQGGLIITHKGRPGDLAVPLPEFSQGRPTTREEAGRLDGVTFEEDATIDWTARFQIPASDLMAYRVDGFVSVDGRLTGEATESHYVVHTGLGIPLHYAEYEGQRMVRELRVTALILGPGE